MEQTPFVQVSEFDRATIDLTKPAHTADEYLKQGIVLRESIPKVVRAEIAEELIEKVDISLFRTGSDLPNCDSLPPCKWVSAQLRMFMSQRLRYLSFCSSNEEVDGEGSVEFPKENEGWISFCIPSNNSNVDGDSNSSSKFVNPSPSILRKMSVKDKNSCLYSLTEYLQSTDEPVEKVFVWIYSLLLSLPLPLSPNTTSILRTLSKRCHLLRSKVPSSAGTHLVYTYSTIIAIIGHCYSQKDLADYKLFGLCDGNVIYQTDPRTGMIFEVPLPATYITPVKGLATFYNSSTPGFQNGNIQGVVAFFQANFPNNQAVVVDCQLEFPDYMNSKAFSLEILLNGDLDSEYCKSGMRFADPLVIKIPRGEKYYVGARKRNDISIINHNESIIGRVLRITCVGCEEDQRILGCSLIGRVDDEVYIEKDPQFIDSQVHLQQQQQFLRAQKRLPQKMVRKSHRKLLVLA